MINERLFKSKMKLYGDTQESLAENLGICYTTLNRKIRGAGDFVQSEIKSIAVKYELTPEELEEIFFA